MRWTRHFWGDMGAESLWTRPYTLAPSRGRLGRGNNAETARESKTWRDGPTDRPTDTASSRVACPRLKSVFSLSASVHYHSSNTKDSFVQPTKQRLSIVSCLWLCNCVFFKSLRTCRARVLSSSVFSPSGSLSILWYWSDLFFASFLLITLLFFLGISKIWKTKSRDGTK